MARYLKENYDVIICGAGPAGLYAANCLQKASADQISVLLLDKKSPWKEPVACAEAVSRKIFSRYWTPKEEWTRQHLDGVYFTSPDMTRVEYFQADCGLILNRAAFHHEMADKAAELGVECHFEDVVEKLFKAENGLWALKIRSGEGESELHAKVVIDATGPGAKITRHVPGLEALESGDFDQEAAVFAIAEGIPHSRRHIELLFGNRFFAGGYGWVFPRDGETVNVGLVGGREFLKTHPPRSTLEKFIHEAYPDAKILAFHGSGIVEAMKSGKIAAECALEWLSATTEEARREIEKSAYSRWMKIQGKTHLSYHRGKDGFASVSDEQFNKAAHRLASIPVHKRSIFRIFWAVLSSSPSILWKMKSFFI